MQHHGRVNPADVAPPPPTGRSGAARLPDLEDATQRLVRRVDELPDESYAARSLLPGWTRGHVVAHLALNAESLEGVLRGAAAGGEPAMYPSQRRRDQDIEDLADATPGELRERLLASVRLFLDAVGDFPEERWGSGFRRLPDSPDLLPAHAVLGMRHREVEIHHVDLDAGYTPREWPGSFVVATVEALRVRAPGVTLLATDLGRSWHAERGRVTVSGPGPQIAWWLSGRGRGEGLTSNGGDLPRIQEW